MTKLYLSNAAASFTPSAVRGSFSDVTLSGASSLSLAKAGVAAIAARAETTFGAADVLLRRWVSEPFANTGLLTGDYTIVLGRVESSTSMNAQAHLHAYISVGSTNTVRGTVIANVIDPTEWPTTAAAGTLTGVVSDLACTAGDRLVIELGYYANNFSSSSMTATLHYGNTGSPDLTHASTAVTTRPGYASFADPNLVLAGPARSGLVTTTTAPATTFSGVGKTASGSVLVTTAPSSVSVGGIGFTVTSTTAAAHTVTGTRDGVGAVIDAAMATHAGTGSHVSDGASVTTTLTLYEFVAAELPGQREPNPPDLDVVTAVFTPPARRTVRFIAQEVLTGRFLDWDLPLRNPEITTTLSGASMITAEFNPELLDVRELGLDASAVWIHAEDNGEIRGSGILAPVAIDGESFSVEAVGVAGYPHGLPYLSELSEIGIDPAEIVRRIWTHLQGYPDGALGVTVSATTTTRRIGEPATPQLGENGEPTFEEDGVTPKMNEAKPYVLAWYSDIDCGREIDALAKSTPFDYREALAWNPDQSAVAHHIELGYPRLGRKRPDLRFNLDENIKAAFVIREEPEHYASEVVVRGRGEGIDSVRGYAGTRSARRVRRVAVLTDKTVPDTVRANALAAEELRRRQAVLTIGEIVVDAHADGAPLGSYAIGDDVLIQAEIPYLGPLALWHRITSFTWRPDSDEVSLQLRRSEQFAYGRAS